MPSAHPSVRPGSGSGKAAGGAAADALALATAGALAAAATGITAALAAREALEIVATASEEGFGSRQEASEPATRSVAKAAASGRRRSVTRDV